MIIKMIINSSVTLFRNVDGADRIQSENFKSLKKGVKRILNANYVISKNDLRTIIDDPDNSLFDAFRLTPTLNENNSITFYLMPILTGGGTAPVPGQGVKVPTT